MVSSENSKTLAASMIALDVGNLMAFDPRPIESSNLRGGSSSNRDEWLRESATMATQLLIERVFQLPVERVEEVYVAKLPAPETLVPREKPVPKQKPATKWEQYAKLKGIQKKKKSRMVFDEPSGEWKPRWGYQRKDDSTKEWCVEIKSNEDPNQDFFSKRTLERNERVAKNELQRLRNVARATKGGKVPGVGITPTVAADPSKPDKLKLKKQLNMAKRSDASMSKFSQKLNGEEKMTKGLGNKRKFESNFRDTSSEKSSQLKILDSITSSRDKSTKEKINAEKAVNKMIDRENTGKSSSEKPKKRRSAAGTHKGSHKGSSHKGPHKGAHKGGSHNKNVRSKRRK